jgi:oligo-1,6-glucosidase
MTNYPFSSLDEIVDIEGVNHAREAVRAGRDPGDVLDGLRAHGRDNARTPMQWDDTDNAGFTSGTPWLPVNPNHAEINAAAQRDDPDSVMHHYRRLIELRHHDPIVVHGDFTMVLADHDTVYAFTRRFGDGELLVMVNVSSNPCTAPIPGARRWADADVVLGGPYRDSMAPWEYRVLRRPVDD